MGHNIRYTRPETRTTVAHIFIPNEDETPKQIRRLESLGYTIVEIAPSLRDQKPTLMSVSSMRR